MSNRRERVCRTSFMVWALLCVGTWAVEPPVALDGINAWADANGFEIVTDTSNTNQNMLDASGTGGNRAGSKDCPALSNTSLGTLYFEFRLQDSGSADLNVGLSAYASQALEDMGSADTPTAMGPTLRIVDRKLQVHDGGFLDAATSLDVGENYRVWMFVNNADDTWQARIKGGAYSTATPLKHSGSDETFAFRGSTGPYPLLSVQLRANNANGAASVLLDNFMMDPDAVRYDDPTEIRPDVVAASGGDQAVELSWQQVPGVIRYRVESTTNLFEPFTKDVSGVFSNGMWYGSVTDNVRFYRVVGEDAP